MVTPNPENNFSQQALVKFINRKIIEIADQSDTGDLFHGLSAYIYDFIVDARSKNYNPRNILASEDHGDLLYEDEVERDPEKRWPCLYELYICLLDSLELERQPDTDVPTGKPEAPNKSQYEVGLMEHQDIGAFDSLASDQ